MRGLSQSFHTVRQSAELVLEIAKHLEAISTPAEGDSPGGVVGAGITTYTLGERTYQLHEPYSPYNYGGPMSPTELAAWFSAESPSAIDAYLYATSPRLVVKFQGGMEYGWITVEANPGMMGEVLDSESLEFAFDQIAEILKAHTTFFDDDPRGNRVFLGHGHGSDWKMIQKAIEDAGFDVAAFETVSAAGVVNIHAVDATIRGSFAAVLHMTPDDAMADGTRRARQNVIHEIGLAQGVLGVTSVVVVHNEESTMPSNLDGVTVVKYRSNGLYDKLDEVVTYLRQIKASPVYGHGDGIH